MSTARVQASTSILVFDHALGRAVKDHVAASDTQVTTSFLEDLVDLEIKVDVELVTLVTFSLDVPDDVLAFTDGVDGGAEAWSEELVFHFLADDGVVTAAFAEEEHASCNLGVAQEGGTSHGVVPIPVYPFEGEDRCKAWIPELLHVDS